MAVMMVLPAWAIIYQMIFNWSPEGRWELTAFGIALLVLQVWMAIRLRQEIQGEWLLGLAGIVSILFGGFVVVAAGNSVNLTDGLDGLAIVPVMVAAACNAAASTLACCSAGTPRRARSASSSITGSGTT